MGVFRSAWVSLGIVPALLVAGCNAAAPSAPTAPSAEAVAREVKAAVRTQVDAYTTLDEAKAASILAPDIKTFFHGEPDVVGKAAAENAIKAQFALPAVKLEVSDESVDVAASGDLAVYHAQYRFGFTNPETKQPVVEVGNWVAIFKRQPDGVMKLSTDIVADTPTPSPAQP